MMILIFLGLLLFISDTWLDIDVLVVVVIFVILGVVEEFGDEKVEVDDVLIGWGFGFVELLEQLVHVFGTELKVVLHFCHPFLVHFVEVAFYQVPNLKVVQSALLVQVYLDDVCDQEQWQLEFFDKVTLVLDFGGDIGDFWDVVIERGFINFFPSHFLYSGAKEE